MSGRWRKKEKKGKSKLALSIKSCNDSICQGIFLTIVSFILNNFSDGNFEQEREGVRVTGNWRGVIAQLL